MHPELAALRTGDYDRAIGLLEQRLEAQPDEPSHYWYLGIAWLLRGDAAQAYPIWLAALGQNGAEVEALTHDLLDRLGTEAAYHMQQGRFDRACVLYAQKLELDATCIDAYLDLGKAHALLGEVDGAIASWQMALDLEPDCLLAHRELATLYQALGQFDEAIAHHQACLSLEPASPQGWQALGYCLAQQDRWAEALPCFEQAVALAPQTSDLWGDLGIARLCQGQLEEGVQALRQSCVTHIQLAMDYVTWNAAPPEGSRSPLPLLNEALWKALLEPDATLWRPLADLMHQANQLTLATRLYEQAIAAAPEDATAYLALAKTLAQLQHDEAAIATCEAALHTTPDWLEARLELARIYTSLGQWDRAIALVQPLVEQVPEQAEAEAVLGNVWLAAQQWDRAIAAYRGCLRLQPDRLETQLNLAIALAYAGHALEAIATLKAVLAQNSNLAPTVAHLIQTWYHQSVWPSADPSFESALQAILPLEVPAGFYATTHEWAIETGQTGTAFIPIHPPQTVELASPQTGDREIHPSFRFPRFLELPGSFVATLPHGRFWIDPDQSSTAILTAENQLLADLSPEFPILSPGHPDKPPGQHWTFVADKLPPLQSISGTVVVLAGLSNSMYFHWMVDVLPRWELLRRSGLNLAEVDWVVASDRHPFQQETLAQLGISPTQILPVEHHSHLQAERLIVPSFAGTVAWMPPWVCQFLRDTFLPAAPRGKGRRLYISRRHTSSRRVVNEAAVMQCLAPLGFEAIALEHYSVKEQAALFAEAEAVVAAHGGGLTNLVFCAPGTRVVELFAPTFVYSCYWLLSNLCQLPYTYVLGAMPEGPLLHRLMNPNPRVDDLYIPLDALRHALQQVELS